MSHTGNKAAVLPAGVEIKQGGNNIAVKGPKGELTREFSSDIKMNIEGNEVTFIRPNDSKEMRTIHGTTRVNFNSMVVGVSKSFQKALELIRVGYRAQVQGNKLTSNVGYSHPIEMTAPEGVTLEAPVNTQVIVKGINKEVAGKSAANIRGVRPPESYKGKGVRYVGEFVRRKESKTSK